MQEYQSLTTKFVAVICTTFTPATPAALARLPPPPTAAEVVHALAGKYTALALASALVYTPKSEQQGGGNQHGD